MGKMLTLNLEYDQKNVLYHLESVTNFLLAYSLFWNNLKKIHKKLGEGFERNKFLSLQLNIRYKIWISLKINRFNAYW